MTLMDISKFILISHREKQKVLNVIKGLVGRQGCLTRIEEGEERVIIIYCIHCQFNKI